MDQLRRKRYDIKRNNLLSPPGLNEDTADLNSVLGQARMRGSAERASGWKFTRPENFQDLKVGILANIKTIKQLNGSQELHTLIQTSKEVELVPGINTYAKILALQKAAPCTIKFNSSEEFSVCLSLT